MYRILLTLLAVATVAGCASGGIDPAKLRKAREGQSIELTAPVQFTRQQAMKVIR
jgi:hypothetical protein